MHTVSNVIPVDFAAKEVPVIVDYTQASAPKSEIAQRLAAEAAKQTEQLGATKGNKAGKLRILSNGRSDLFDLNPYLIKIRDGWNSRVMTDPENIAHIDWLARSIMVNGVQEALTVSLEGDDVYVDNGHCRLLATFRAIEVYGAEIKAVPCMAESRYATDGDRLMSQIVRNSGKPLTVMEQGAVFVKLIALRWNEKQIAEKAGLTQVRVTQILDLMADSNDSIKAMVTNGQVSFTTASQVLRDADGDAAAAEQTLTEAVTVAKAAGKTRATAKHIKAAGRGETVVKPTSTKAVLQSIFLSKSTKVETTGKVTVVTLTTANWKEISQRLNLA